MLSCSGTIKAPHPTQAVVQLAGALLSRFSRSRFILLVVQPAQAFGVLGAEYSSSAVLASFDVISEPVTTLARGACGPSAQQRFGPLVLGESRRFPEGRRGAAARPSREVRGPRAR